MMKKFVFCMYLLLGYHVLYGAQLDQPRILIITPGKWGANAREPIGFFAYFKSIVGCLNFYDKHKNDYDGVKIILEKGTYFCAQLGPNWWEYYFEPIPLNGKEYVQDVAEFQDMVHFTFSGKFSRKDAHEIIEKYIRIKPDIKNEVDLFVKQNFEHCFIIGIHYRGTDKVSETARVDYEVIGNQVAKIITKYGLKSYKIFVATDEQAFIHYMEKEFSNVIYTQAARSNDGQAVHYISNNSIYLNDPFRPYILGRQALVDCLLLARCNVMVKTHQSHFGSTAGAFNYRIPIISVDRNNIIVLGGNSNYNDR